MITLKRIGSAPARLQRLLLRLQNYQLTVSYKPGKQLLLADSFSRNKNTTPDTPEPITINLINFTPNTDYILHNKNDPTHILLRHTIIEGWPRDRRHLPQTLRD